MATVSRRISALVPVGSCLAVLGTMLTTPTAQAAAARFTPRPLQRTASVPVRAVRAVAPAPDPAAARARPGTPAAALRAAGAVDVALPAASSPPADARAGALPVAVSGQAVSRARVETLDQSQAARAGLRGVLLRMAGPTAGRRLPR